MRGRENTDSKSRSAGRTDYSVFTEKGNVLFEQARLSLECKKLYADAIKPECFLDKESIEKWYGGAHGGLHKMYIVEIENIYSK